jgi:hypothetical protein
LGYTCPHTNFQWAGGRERQADLAPCRVQGSMGSVHARPCFLYRAVNPPLFSPWTYIGPDLKLLVILTHGKLAPNSKRPLTSTGSESMRCSYRVKGSGRLSGVAGEAFRLCQSGDWTVLGGVATKPRMLLSEGDFGGPKQSSRSLTYIWPWARWDDCSAGSSFGHNVSI